MKNSHETESLVPSQPIALQTDTLPAHAGSAVAIILAVSVLLNALARLVKACQG